MDFSSWPRDQEQTFVVYEQQQASSSRSALVAGCIVGAIALVFGLGVYAGVDPKSSEVKGMNMSNLTKQSAQAPAPAPAPKQAPAPAPAPAPSSDKPAAPDQK
jgi:hypothetical protein